jgi:hypothetical protein
MLRIDNAPGTLLSAGDRVELHPATDAWMRGERFGEVLRSSQYRAPTLVRVKLDARVHHEDCAEPNPAVVSRTLSYAHLAAWIDGQGGSLYGRAHAQRAARLLPILSTSER